MDGINRMGSLGNISSIGKGTQPIKQQPTDNQPLLSIDDQVSLGTGMPVVEKKIAGNKGKDETAILEQPKNVEKKKETEAYEGFFLSSGLGSDSSDPFSDLGLNGPSHLGDNLMTLSGQPVNSPRFLLAE